MVKCGSYFHQFNPICSALSTEQISKRMRMVSNSTFANETRISPAITKPLSRTRSKMSTRFVVPETAGTLSIQIALSFLGGVTTCKYRPGDEGGDTSGPAKDSQ